MEITIYKLLTSLA